MALKARASSSGPQILAWAGTTALSSFRLAKLAGRLAACEAGVQGVTARFEYFVDLGEPLDALAEARLRRLLDAPAGAEPWPVGETVLVVPRTGTISPWSSKATDIVRICGLGGIRRVERGIRYRLAPAGVVNADALARLAPFLHDRMTQSLVTGVVTHATLFATQEPGPLRHVPLRAQGREALVAADRDLGLALSDDEIDYLAEKYAALARDPTDAELMMFAQANSEHCRHKIFNADWIIDGEPQRESLFDMIRSTHAASPRGILSAYRDNAAVMAGAETGHLLIEPVTSEYRFVRQPVHSLMKVETHNHPTAISPHPGAATGAGGEIRDEGATGRGGRPKAGLTGFSVSNLLVPDFVQPWEWSLGRPDRIASALEIMLEGPIGAAAFNNEFGRPNIAGYFRTYEQPDPHVAGRARGYHKPIMLAGGLGNVADVDVHKAEVPAGALLIVLGGPAMLIGLGGGAASSVGSGQSAAELDFASVQRGNPEIQRRAQQVIEACCALAATAGRANPLLIIHDVGAGGLSNAVPELVDHSHRGARLELRDIPSAAPGMSPLEIWCNEAQERYVLAITPGDLDWFDAVCARERCPYAVLGALDPTGRLVVGDRLAGERVVDLPLEVLLGKAPRTLKHVQRVARSSALLDLAGIELAEACQRVLRMPAVADKSFLIHIGDRTVGGLVARDQLVGPWQVPVSDVGVTTLGFETLRGEAMAVGERTPVALVDAPASGRLAVAEAVTNIAAADVASVGEVRLSANWMAASGLPAEDEALFDTVRAVTSMCRQLGIAIPVGKDSLSMQTRWSTVEGERAVVAPVSLVVSAFAPVADARRTWTPQLADRPGSVLLLIDLGRGRDRLGGSCLAQAYNRAGGPAPDCDEPALLGRLVELLARLRERDLVLAYHDRSDGGLLATLCEMAFAGHVGLEIALPPASREGLLGALFAEEPGAVVQLDAAAVPACLELAEQAGLGGLVREVAQVVGADRISVRAGADLVFDRPRTALHATWSELSYRLQAQRDNPETAREAYAALTQTGDPGLRPSVNFDAASSAARAARRSGQRPRVAILREQGVNSQLEMAAAFHRAGFAPIDVHMSDLLAGRVALADFRGLAACGGFSYGDVLGAGGGWAKSILFHDAARAAFAEFFSRPDTFTLGVCNGCQMLANLAEIIPGADHWPRFVQNRSEQFEARLSLVEILESSSVLLAGMAGSRLLIPTSHGEGRARFDEDADLERCRAAGQLALRYVDAAGQVAQTYPANPNGSPAGLAGLCSADGRVTILMPHPERVFRSVQHSWCPREWLERDEGPWFRLFENARAWVG